MIAAQTSQRARPCIRAFQPTASSYLMPQILVSAITAARSLVPPNGLATMVAMQSKWKPGERYPPAMHVKV